MALELTGKVAAKAAKAEIAKASPNDTVVLELALYTRWNFRGTHFEKGVKYRFKREDAIQMLELVDHGRSVWRVWRPAKPLQDQKPLVLDKDGAVDLSSADLKKPQGNLIDSQADAPPKFLEIGNEDDIAGLIEEAQPSPEDVEV